MLAAFALSISLAACQQERDDVAGWQDIAIAAAPASLAADSAGKTYGELIFRGGLELSSENKLFGGWSGLEVDEAGKLIAVSDTGMWLSAQLVFDDAGALTGLKDTRIALMRDEEGDPLGGKINQDAEGLAKLDDGRYAVSFERRHRIWIYDLDKNGPMGHAAFGPEVPTKELGENEGLEGLSAGPHDDILALGELAGRFFDFQLKGEDGPVIGEAQVSSNYALVGLDKLPDGDYVALERFYFPIIGVRNAIRRYPVSGLISNPPKLSGPVLAQFAPPLLVDNFEAISAVPGKDGAVRLYILSDDNFNPEQKTLLYAFDLPAPSEPSASPPRPVASP